MRCAKQFSITVEEDSGCFINPSSLPGAFYGRFYTEVLVPTSGEPGTFAVTAGALPFGVTLNPATGAFGDFPDDVGEVGTTLNFTVTFTPTDILIAPCSQAFTLAVTYYCNSVEDLTWAFNNGVPPANQHDPAQIEVVMVGGDGTFAINRPLNGLAEKVFQMTSSDLWCLVPPFAPYLGSIEIDWNLVLASSGGGASSYVDITADLNGGILFPALSRFSTPPGISDSGTHTISMGNLNPGTNYVIEFRIITRCIVNGSVDFSGVVRVRPLAPPP